MSFDRAVTLIPARSWARTPCPSDRHFFDEHHTPNNEPLIMTTPTIIPPFTLTSARAKVRAAEDGWNSRDPDRVVLAYTEDTVWRNRSDFLVGREAIRTFLQGKWRREREYRLIKSLWAFGDNRIAVRFQYEWHDDDNRWWRSYGNEQWQFAADGRMARREASINDVAISDEERRFTWSAPGPRPADVPDILDVR